MAQGISGMEGHTQINYLKCERLKGKENRGGKSKINRVKRNERIKVPPAKP